MDVAICGIQHPFAVGSFHSTPLQTDYAMLWRGVAVSCFCLAADKHLFSIERPLQLSFKACYILAVT